MGRTEQVAECTKAGFSPARTAAELGIAFSSTLDYLERAVGRGLIRRSDICFTIPQRARHAPGTNEERQVMERFGQASHALGDLYEDLRAIECTLHSHVRALLVDRYGSQESGWWRQGIPETVRTKCQQRRESDQHPVQDPYCYTDLLDMHDIIGKAWATLSPLAGELQSDKRAFLDSLVELNEIRRMVMHPSRGIVPDEKAFRFVGELRRRLGVEAPYSEYEGHGNVIALDASA